MGKDKGTIIEALAITDYFYYMVPGRPYPEGYRSFLIDGISITAKDGKDEAVFEVATIDETGVSGYSWVLDNKYDKVADVTDMAQNLSTAVTTDIDEDPTQALQADMTFDFKRYSRTIPETRSDGLFSKLEISDLPGAGMLFLHIRARDGRGNWGPTTHYPYFVPGAEKGGKAGDRKVSSPQEDLGDILDP